MLATTTTTSTGSPPASTSKTAHSSFPTVDQPTMPPRWGELPTLPPPRPAAAPTSNSSPGQVVLVDNFDDPTQGRLPIRRSGGGTLEYVAGEYQLLKTDPASSMLPNAIVPGTYA